MIDKLPESLRSELKYFINVLNNAIAKEFSETLFMTRTVDEIIFGYQDPLLKFLSDFNIHFLPIPENGVFGLKVLSYIEFLYLSIHLSVCTCTCMSPKNILFEGIILRWVPLSIHHFFVCTCMYMYIHSPHIHVHVHTSICTCTCTCNMYCHPVWMYMYMHPYNVCTCTCNMYCHPESISCKIIIC